MGRLQGQGLDAVGQQATGGIVILIRQIQFVGARLLDWGDEPALGRGSGAGVLTLRGEEAVGLGNSSLTGVEAVLRQVVDKLVLKERLHGIAGPRHNLGGARGVCGGRSQPVALWSCVHPVQQIKEHIRKELVAKKKNPIVYHRRTRINHTARHLRVIIVPEAFGERVVIDLQLCDLKQTSKKRNPA